MTAHFLVCGTIIWIVYSCITAFIGREPLIALTAGLLATGIGMLLASWVEIEPILAVLVGLVFAPMATLACVVGANKK